MGSQQNPLVAFKASDLEVEGRREATSLAAGLTSTGARWALTALERLRVVGVHTEGAAEVAEAMIQRQQLQG